MNFNRKPLLGNLIRILLLAVVLALSPGNPTAASSPELSVSSVDVDTTIYLPAVQLNHNDVFDVPGSVSAARKINAPYFSDSIIFSRMSIAWFGELSPVDNYTDIRVGYSNDSLVVTLSILDRYLFFDQTPSINEIQNWDAASMYISLDQNPGSQLGVDEYQFVAQVNHWQPREDYQAVYQGNGTTWSLVNLPFETETMWRGEGFNDLTKLSKGWAVTFRIPFESIGLQEPPHNANWRLGFAIHDRDDPAGSPISDKIWPESTLSNRPDTWGLLHFGIPENLPVSGDYDGTTVIRHGFDGAIVEDAHVGGAMTCGDYVDYWSEWPNLNYGTEDLGQINIQNQRDVSDFPCFSKFLISFPMDSVPEGVEVISATLTMHQFGSSGTGWDDDPQDSFIQVLTIAEDWDPSTITWNTVPYAVENFGGLRVEPLPVFPGWPGVPRTWNISPIVQQTVQTTEPLRLVLYSADSAIHSGKYFYSSDSNSDGSARPYITVYWKNP